MKIAGIGLRKDATLSSLQSALRNADAGDQLDALATPQDKATHPALVALANTLGLTIIGVEPADIAAQVTLTQSTRVQQKRGTGSVAEACALAAAGAGANLLGPRAVSDDHMATCAIAIGGDA